MISIPDFARSNAGNFYLLIDCTGADALSTTARITVNNIILNGPVIPGLALLPDLEPMKSLGDDRVYRECEHIFAALTSASGISNCDLRQWFLVPVPPALVENSTADKELTVEIENVGNGPFTLYGSFNTNPQYLMLPALTLYSWEKAFYGVENNEGFSDPRYDIKVSKQSARASASRFICKGVPVTDDLSPLAGRQTGNFNIRLLSVPPSGRQSEETAGQLFRLTESRSEFTRPASNATAGVADNGIAGVVSRMFQDDHGASPSATLVRTLTDQHSTGASSAADAGKRIVRRHAWMSSSQLAFRERLLAEDENNSESASVIKVENLPGAHEGELWLVRFTGELKGISDRPVPGPSVTFEAKNASSRKIFYDSPWVPYKLDTDNQWHHFDFSVPLFPDIMPGELNAVTAKFITRLVTGPNFTSTDNESRKVGYRNIRIMLYRLPSNPLVPGHQIL